MVHPEEFVRTWQSCETFDQFKSIVKLSDGCIRGRATYYRKNGVPLKQLKREPGNRQVDFEALKRICTNGEAQESTAAAPQASSAETRATSRD